MSSLTVTAHFCQDYHVLAAIRQCLEKVRSISQRDVVGTLEWLELLAQQIAAVLELVRSSYILAQQELAKALFMPMWTVVMAWLARIKVLLEALARTSAKWTAILAEWAPTTAAATAATAATAAPGHTKRPISVHTVTRGTGILDRAPVKARPDSSDDEEDEARHSTSRRDGPHVTQPARSLDTIPTLQATLPARLNQAQANAASSTAATTRLDQQSPGASERRVDSSRRGGKKKRQQHDKHGAGEVIARNGGPPPKRQAARAPADDIDDIFGDL
ncbi:uncharacterized protein MONBRDRAFT_5778 [Monosiga brevicollis MX1]|uniref:Uncharacterized protein n=1 Tax=Monosiga brevicollis TaxID=81824 RepID=A9USF6_MONBE|nr:uncharacterized protein MONBRDRAFT_5778 [Monosiga brevicollis MX1]EDQ92094.1 predicted protein [Monosiga brevicollis MX1]|eukprot:XP_001743380.1 hypothetical protein [Monosiga brevicollis MX1]